MSAGDKEVVLASEEVQRRNINAMLEHGNETRRLVLELKKEVQQMKNQIIIQEKTITELRQLLASVQAKLYQGGT